MAADPKAKPSATMKCGVGHYTTRSCGLYGAHPKETGVVTLGSCQRDVDSHLRALQLSRHQSTTVADEGLLIAFRAGLFT
jgi:hypothetical protein